MKSLQGTPYHITTLTKKANDERRHKAKCCYYRKDTKECHCAPSPYWLKPCPGSARCKYYALEYPHKLIRYPEKNTKRHSKHKRGENI